MADRAGMAQSILSDIESGKRNPTVKTLKRLATALRCEIELRLVRRNTEPKYPIESVSLETPYESGVTFDGFDLSEIGRIASTL